MTTLYLLVREEGSYSDYSAEVLAVCADEPAAVELAERHYQARRMKENAEYDAEWERVRAMIAASPPEVRRTRHPFLLGDEPPPWYQQIPPGPLTWARVPRPYGRPDAEPVMLKAEAPIGNDTSYLIAPVVLGDLGPWLDLP